ncbi:MAG TPA: DUF5673 domain-containing protein [Bacteroidota bacterium]|nr:DUF5673 domain-containing protein [Bacteroidota bacterium]
MEWLAIFAAFLGIAFLFYTSRSKTVSRHPSQRGLFIGTGLALLGVSGWVLIQNANPQFASDDLFDAAAIVLAVPLYWLVISYPFKREKAGNILHAVPKARMRLISGFATAALFIVLMVFTVQGKDSARNKAAEIFFYTGVVVYFASPFFGKIELRENGIIESYTLIPWNAVLSFHWTDDQTGTLVLAIKHPLRKSAMLVVPAAQKGTVDKIFKDRVPPSGNNV